MTVTVPHHRTQPEAISIIDKGSSDLFAGVAGSSVEVADEKKDWNGSTMNFSFTGRLGFISVPINGAISVDDVNVVVVCDMPPMVQNFIGEDKVSASIEKQLQRLL